MNHGNEFNHKMNLFDTIDPLGRSAPISVKGSLLGSSNMLYEGNTSPWEGLRSGYSSTSPPGTASSSSSVSYGYSKSSEDLSVDSLISNLLQVVNGEKCRSSCDIKLPLVNDFSNHQFHNCTDPYCETCLTTRQTKYSNSNNLMDQFLNFGNSPLNISSSPIINLPSSSPPPSLSQYCDIHRDSQKLYCQTCTKLFCSDCEIQHHLGHITMHLMEAIECAGAQSNQILDDVKNRINVLTKDLEMVQIAADNLEHKAHQATTDVLVCMQRATVALEAREKELLERIEKMRLVKRAALKVRDDNLRNSIRRLSKAADRLAEAKESSTLGRNPFELLLATDLVSSEVFRTRSCRHIIPVQDENWISFSGSETNVLEAITNLGSIVVNPPGSIGDGRALKGRGNSPQIMQQPNLHQQQSQLILASPIPRGRPILSNSFPVVITSGRNSVSSPPKTSCIIGADGEMNDNLCRPWGIACDRDGHIIIADRSNNRIQIFKEDGTFVRKFGVHGTGPGQFDRPAGVTVDARRRVIVADKDNHRIQILTMEGVYLLSFGEKGSRTGQFNYPWDVAANTECQIVVSDTRNHRIQLFSPEGVFLRKYGFETSPSMWKHFDSPRGVAFNPDGDIVTTDFNNHRIVVIDYDFLNAKVVGYDNNMGIKQFLRPQGLVVDDDGNIIVSDSRNHRIQVLDSNGNLKWKFGSYGKGPDEMDRPSGIALTPSGRIAVVDFGNNRVMIY